MSRRDFFVLQVWFCESYPLSPQRGAIGSAHVYICQEGPQGGTLCVSKALVLQLLVAGPMRNQGKSLSQLMGEAYDGPSWSDEINCAVIEVGLT